jgi:hypothetical protein
VAFYLNGVQDGVDSLAAIFDTAPDVLYLGNAAANSYLNGHIKEIAYWDGRLPNETLDDLSTNGL